MDSNVASLFKKIKHFEKFFQIALYLGQNEHTLKKISSHDVCTLTFFLIIITLDSLIINHIILSLFLTDFV